MSRKKLRFVLSFEVCVMSFIMAGNGYGFVQVGN
jgi:hypothetical protein